MIERRLQAAILIYLWAALAESMRWSIRLSDAALNGSIGRRLTGLVSSCELQEHAGTTEGERDLLISTGRQLLVPTPLDETQEYAALEW